VSRPRQLIVLVLAPVLAAACTHGSTSSPRHSTVAAPGTATVASPPSAAAVPVVNAKLVVTYPVGAPQHTRPSPTARCPTAARCAVRRLPFGRKPHLYQLVAVRRLTCAPGGSHGDYADATAACRSAHQFVELLERPHLDCKCVQSADFSAHATGVLAGTHINLELTGCAVCGLGEAAIHDVVTLTPV
jgi:hypothetical protein